jgi:hypothetical protein
MRLSVLGQYFSAPCLAISWEGLRNTRVSHCGRPSGIGERLTAGIFQAADCGCHIVTVPHDILAKVMKLGAMELEELSLDTVRMFHQDAVVAGVSL